MRGHDERARANEATLAKRTQAVRTRPKLTERQNEANRRNANEISGTLPALTGRARTTQSLRCAHSMPPAGKTAEGQISEQSQLG
jgi:hypothetical protein